MKITHEFHVQTHSPDNEGSPQSWALQKGRIALWGESGSHLPTWPQALSGLSVPLCDADHASKWQLRGYSLLAGREMYVRSYAQKRLLGGLFHFSKAFLLRYSHFMGLLIFLGPRSPQRCCDWYNPVFRLSICAFPIILQVYAETVPSVLEQLHLWGGSGSMVPDISVFCT